MPLNDNDEASQCEVPLPLVSVKTAKNVQGLQKPEPRTWPPSQGAVLRRSFPDIYVSGSPTVHPFLRRSTSSDEAKGAFNLPVKFGLSIALLTVGIILGGVLVGFVMKRVNDTDVNREQLAALRGELAVLKENCAVVPEDVSDIRYASPAPLARPLESERRKRGDKAEVILLPAPDGSVPAQRATNEKNEGKDANTSSAYAGSADLPEFPSRDDVRKAMDRVSPAVRSCTPEAKDRITVKVVVDGATGRVVEAYATGRHAASQAGVCAQMAAKKAVFPKFSGGSLSIKYPFEL